MGKQWPGVRAAGQDTVPGDQVKSLSGLLCLVLERLYSHQQGLQNMMWKSSLPAVRCKNTDILFTSYGKGI